MLSADGVLYKLSLLLQWTLHKLQQTFSMVENPLKNVALFWPVQDRLCSPGRLIVWFVLFVDLFSSCLLFVLEAVNMCDATVQSVMCEARHKVIIIKESAVLWLPPTDGWMERLASPQWGGRTWVLQRCGFHHCMLNQSIGFGSSRYCSPGSGLYYSWDWNILDKQIEVWIERGRGTVNCL